jgi:rhamnulose-1-phosphate aldolase/alcohol dehydrogenase
MLNRYRDDEAQRAVDTYGPRWGEHLALRTYTSRLIGAEPSLVLHGGGNTSVKDVATNVLGDAIDVLYVKGSGWDLASIEPPGFPAVKLDHLRRLVHLPTLSDEDMVNEQRVNMLDAGAPNASVEALLHAFLPARYVDHSHADAILQLTNHADGEAYVRDALGDDLLLVPYVKPGFDLAALCARLFAANPGCTGMILMSHGLFTWGDTAKASYDRHIELVSTAERWLAARPPRRAVRVPTDVRDVTARVAPLLRGALHDGRSWLLDHRAGDDLLALLADDRLDRWATAGLLTPDHVIRTRPRPCVVRPPLDQGDEALAAALREAVATWRAGQDAYFQAHAAGRPLRQLDGVPRVVLVPGVGLFGVGATTSEARIAADLGERTLQVKEDTEGVGPFQGLGDAELFEVEYWSLEQAKLGQTKERPLSRKVALVTGGAGAIGVGVAAKLLEAGAAVVLADRDAAGLTRARAALGAKAACTTVVTDVTDAASVAAAFAHAARTFGGVDVVVPNAGVALSAPITDIDPADFRRVMEVNGTGTFLTVQAAARELLRQGTGGHLILISSKNVFGPGEEFAAYSASKAAAHQVGRVAALELARHGVAVNMINPDAVFAHGDIPSGLWAAVGPDRARARGMDPADLPDFYRQRNLLQATVTAEHVGNAVVFFASGLTPTTGASLPVDGGVAGAFPR